MRVGGHGEGAQGGRGDCFVEPTLEPGNPKGLLETTGRKVTLEGTEQEETFPGRQSRAKGLVVQTLVIGSFPRTQNDWLKFPTSY